ncbi:MAG: DUF4259 domain-containing protein [Allosphingosinicella sp.]
MGAWGSGSFENDTALDWAEGVQSVTDVRRPFERLKEVTDAGGEDETAYIDADLASEAIAAAETVALLMGRTIPGFPEGLRERLRDAGEPDDLLFHQARNAICHVLRNSELAELWAESAAESGTNAWHAEITALVDRLNPDLESIPWEPEDIEQRAGGPVGSCAFCDGPIGRDQLFGMNLHDYSDTMSFSQDLWFHLACLNARLHHKHAILDLKFDPDRMPDLDQL